MPGMEVNKEWLRGCNQLLPFPVLIFSVCALPQEEEDGSLCFVSGHEGEDSIFP